MNGATCNVEIAGAANVQALAINLEAVSRPTALSLRLKQMKLNPTARSLPNVFSAQIAEVIYPGDHVRIQASVFVIKLQNSDDQAGRCDHDRLQTEDYRRARCVRRRRETPRTGRDRCLTTLLPSGDGMAGESGR
ncbi:hypothetical protein N2603_38635 [Bradyrhizobium huanghuaihaiense]|uniref:hypothetical protein n=1 Tax=Bradyrhizobium huanghuaihaiense TaxID=990078 RepID=UPI0021AABB67|nr:hypothetical protein [Bradyrhizobium sp. CB3035]UWU75819.1 hypothetical protein N2603_38635 [Bradyrhizobium sp. CB3035]